MVFRDNHINIYEVATLMMMDDLLSLLLCRVAKLYVLGGFSFKSYSFGCKRPIIYPSSLINWPIDQLWLSKINKQSIVG